MPNAIKPKTITWSEITRLSFCNSKRCPNRIVLDGVVMEWVGIGWITLDRKPRPTDVVVIK